MEWGLLQIIEILNSVWEYIKDNSIDFISMVASILIAIETNKWMEKRNEKIEKKHLVEELLSEIDIINSKLKVDSEKEKNNIEDGKLILKLIPYNLPVWSNIKNTNKINFLVENNGYKDILAFYSEICELNEWEHTLTYYVLFAQNTKEDKEEENFYKDLLVGQVLEQREKVMSLAERAHKSLKEG